MFCLVFLFSLSGGGVFLETSGLSGAMPLLKSHLEAICRDYGIDTRGMTVGDMEAAIKKSVSERTTTLALCKTTAPAAKRKAQNPMDIEAMAEQARLQHEMKIIQDRLIALSVEERVRDMSSSAAASGAADTEDVGSFYQKTGSGVCFRGGGLHGRHGKWAPWSSKAAPTDHEAQRTSSTRDRLQKKLAAKQTKEGDAKDDDAKDTEGKEIGEGPVNAYEPPPADAEGDKGDDKEDSSEEDAGCSQKECSDEDGPEILFYLGGDEEEMDIGFQDKVGMGTMVDEVKEMIAK